MFQHQVMMISRLNMKSHLNPPPPESCVISYQHQIPSQQKLLLSDMENRRNREMGRVSSSSFKGTTCSLCHMLLDVSSDPKILTCFHPICAPCALSSQNSIFCNKCQTRTEPIGLHVFFLKEFLDNESSDTVWEADGPRTKRMIMCCCCEEGDMEWSRSLCKNCSGPLCTECFKFHSKMKELKSHELEQSPDDPLIEEAASHLKSELNCKLHSNSFLTSFCETCQEILCISGKEAHLQLNHDVLQVTDSKCSLYIKMNERMDQLISDLQEKKLTLQVSSGIHTKSIERINHEERLKQSQIQEFQLKMKRFIDEVVENATEKLKIQSDVRRGELIKIQEEIAVRSSRLEQMTSFIQGVRQQEFTAGIFKNHDIMTARVKEEMQLKTPEPQPEHKRLIRLKDFFDGQFIVDTFFTFLRTNATNDELIRSFRSNLYQKGQRGSPQKLTSCASLPPALNSIICLQPPKDAALVTDSQSTMIRAALPPPLLKMSSSEMKINPVRPLIPLSLETPNGHKTCDSCILCMADSEYSTYKCCNCQRVYHTQCHIPEIKTIEDKWICIMCDSTKMDSEKSYLLNDRQRTLCCKVLVSLMAKLKAINMQTSAALNLNLMQIKKSLYPESNSDTPLFNTIQDFSAELLKSIKSCHSAHPHVSSEIVMKCLTEMETEFLNLTSVHLKYMDWEPVSKKLKK